MSLPRAQSRTLPGSLWTPQGERLLRPVAGGAEPSLRGGGQDFETLGADAATTQGKELIGGGANVKGAYVELSSAVPFEVGGLIVTIATPYPAAYDGLVDIAVGPPGAEAVIVPNLAYVANWYVIYSTGNVCVYYLPVSIPEGERLAARCQTKAGKLRILVTLLALGGLASKPFQRATTYGAVTADSGGTSIDPGGAAHTKGAWTELAAATSADLRELILALGNRTNAGLTNLTYWLIDLGVGPAGSEQVLIGDLHLHTGALATGTSPSVIGPLPVNIPEGTRIAARAQCSITDATDRLFDMIVYGFG